MAGLDPAILGIRDAATPVTMRGSSPRMTDKGTKERKRMRRIALLAAFLISTGAHAEVNEVKVAKQFSIGYLQINTMEHQKLIEKHTKAAGQIGRASCRERV